MAELNSDKNIKKKSEPVTIRCISTKPGSDKVKFMFHTVANNKQLMKNVGFVISDPSYDAKMLCVKEKRPYSVDKPKVEEVKIKEIEAKVAESPKAEEPKAKRTRRSKEQIETDKKLQTV